MGLGMDCCTRPSAGFGCPATVGRIGPYLSGGTTLRPARVAAHAQVSLTWTTAPSGPQERRPDDLDDRYILPRCSTYRSSIGAPLTLALHIAATQRIDPLTRYAEEWAGFGGMSPPQQRFHHSLNRKRLLLAANQIGKTRAGAAEA